MRGASVLAVIGAALALGTQGCTTSPPPFFELDASVEETAFVDDGAVESGLDAFDWPDTGPPLPPVLPAQSWVAEVLLNGQAFEVTFDLDARAESGTVRVVAGGGGRATSTIFDILSGGVLRARAPIPMGVPGDHTCSYDTFAIDQWTLQFADHDGDGIHETLTSASTGTTITQTSRTLPPSSFDAFVTVQNVHADADGPNIGLFDTAPVGGFDPVIVLASEPVAPAFMPRLVGPRTVLLVPDVGASAPARWTADTRDLLAGHYDLMLDTEVRDVAGHAMVTPLPTLSFDVAALAPPAADDFDPVVISVFAARAPTLIGDDPGETALVGATSLLCVGRTIIAFDSLPGHRTLSMVVRYEAPASVVMAPAMVTIYDPRNQLVGQSTDYQSFSPPTSIPGFEWESVAHPLPVSYLASSAGRYYAVIDPGGAPDPSCTGSPAVPGIGMVLDQVRPM